MKGISSTMILSRVIFNYGKYVRRLAQRRELQDQLVNHLSLVSALSTLL